MTEETDARAVPEGSRPGRPASGGRVVPGRRIAFLALAALLGATACRKTPPLSLEVLVPVLPPSLDPFSDSRLVSRSIFTSIYEPLVEESAFGMRPAVAESWTNPSPDTWVFRIAAGARFHDGAPVTSRDVVEAVLSSRTATGSVASLADLKTIEATDERTVRMRTQRPAGDFLLAVSALFVPRRADGTFLGTGPYRVVARTPDRLILRKASRPGRPEPLLEEVVFRRTTSAAEGLRLMRRPVPVAVLDPTPEMIAEARRDPRFRVAVAESGGLAYLAVGFAAGAGPLEDVRVRRALRLSLDLPALVRAGTLAGGTPVARVVPPGSFGFDPKLVAVRRDLDEARRLLALAGYPNGFEATLDVNPVGRSAAEAVASQAAEAGIRLEVVVHPQDEFVALVNGRSPLYLYRWFVGMDAGQALRNAFHTKVPARGLGSMNRTGYSSRAVDAAFARLAAAPMQEKRLRCLREISDLLDADLPWIPLFSEREPRILPAWLDLPRRPDGLFVLTEARKAGPGR